VQGQARVGGGGDGGGQEARELRKLEKNRTFGFSGEVRKGYREESQYNNNFLAGDLRPPFLGEAKNIVQYETAVIRRLHCSCDG
jgi:hypothetical protein